MQKTTKQQSSSGWFQFSICWFLLRNLGGNGGEESKNRTKRVLIATCLSWTHPSKTFIFHKVFSSLQVQSFLHSHHFLGVFWVCLRMLRLSIHSCCRKCLAFLAPVPLQHLNCICFQITSETFLRNKNGITIKQEHILPNFPGEPEGRCDCQWYRNLLKNSQGYSSVIIQQANQGSLSSIALNKTIWNVSRYNNMSKNICRETYIHLSPED